MTVMTIDNANDEQVDYQTSLCLKLNIRQSMMKVDKQSILSRAGKVCYFHAGIVKEIEWENIDGILTPVENGDAC